MRHLRDGVIRRMLDEAMAASARDREHLDQCMRCRGRFDEIAENAGHVAHLLHRPEVHPRTSEALVALRRRSASRATQPLPIVGFLRPSALSSRKVAAAGGIAALVAALGFTPAGSLAQSFISVFEPTQVTAVPVSVNDLKNLPDLRKFGTLQIPHRLPERPVASAGAASSLAGTHVSEPLTFPKGTPRKVSYQVMPGSSATFTFNATKAAKATGKPSLSTALRLNGATLKLTTGTAVIAVYGGSGQDYMPALVVGQMRAPRVTAQGASVKNIEDYVLALPGVSPRLAAAVRALGNPPTSLPIPIPIDHAQSHDVTVQGVRGIAIGDSTGIGSAVVWEKNGSIYGVAGTQPESDIIRTANSLR